ncbi:MAG: type VI secretion system tube protein Hcp [Paracoccaceae bacterium]
MPFDSFMYFTGPGAGGSAIEGETTDKAMSANKAFELESFTFTAENSTNIGSATGGAGGGGKVTIEKVSFTKKGDKASAGLLKNLMTGGHFDEVFVSLRRSGGTAGGTGSEFVKFSFKMCAISSFEYSASDGDDDPEESVTMDFGAVKMEYFAQDKTGKMGKAMDALWSRKLNSPEYAV